MFRCLELAALGAGYTAPNPLVGAVLVHEGIIIGEGYHQKYGEAHAEPNCINDAIRNGHSELLKHSTLYVSLEPCVHYGKTPPCADLIIRTQIPKVVVGCRDPFKEVDGKGIDKLRAAGIDVITDVLINECREMNKRFLTFHTRRWPYIILKWAQTGDGQIGQQSAVSSSERVFITNEYSNRLVHRWRSEEAAILVGTNTAMTDNPELTTRLWPGPSPVRMVVDMDLKLPSTLNLFNGEQQTIIFNALKHEKGEKNYYWQVTRDVSLVQQMLNALYQLKLLSVIVEGGSYLLQSFIDEDTWDEARVIKNQAIKIGEGIAAPRLNGSIKFAESKLGEDLIEYYHPATH